MTEKKCPSCGEVKPITEFYRDKKAKDGKTPHCKKCHNLQTILYRKNTPNYKERRAEVDRVRKYGLSNDEYTLMLSNQNNRCGICGKLFTSQDSATVPHVDHDHETGKVRALLCKACNTALGSLKDNPELCIRAAAYLNHYSQTQITNND